MMKLNREQILAMNYLLLHPNMFRDKWELSSPTSRNLTDQEVNELIKRGLIEQRWLCGHLTPCNNCPCPFVAPNHKMIVTEKGRQFIESSMNCV